MPFTDEHEALRAEVRRWVDERLTEHPDADGSVADLAREAGALGYLGAGQPEEVGGSGGDLLAAVVVGEELGRSRAGGVAVSLLAQAHLGPWLLRGVGGAAPGLVAEALDGGRPLAVADGTGSAVLNARRASAVVVAAEDRLTLVTDGWESRDLEGGRLGWDGADVAAVELAGTTYEELAAGREAAELIDAQHRRWWLVRAAAIVAAGWRTWEEARAYALEREAFGQPIARFQVNRHGLADAATRLTAAQQLVRDLSFAATRGTEAHGQAAAAWWYAARTAAAVTDACLQLHGGFGYTMEFPVQRAWRDARMHGWEPGGLERARDRVLAAIDV